MQYEAQSKIQHIIPFWIVLLGFNKRVFALFQDVDSNCMRAKSHWILAHFWTLKNFLYYSFTFSFNYYEKTK